jgi:SAM-dependent methyltransferase
VGDESARGCHARAVSERPNAKLERPRELARTFDGVAARYDRPGYPSRVFEVLVERCGLGPGCRVLEIGPGTGQATLPMLDAGAEITAVEPGAALARRLAERTGARSVDVIVSGFEQVDLPEAAFDLVASATAFHWVDTTLGLDRCARYLRDRGWLALWWTFWGDPDRPDPFHDALQPILRRKAPHLLAEDVSARAYLRDVAARAAEIETTGVFDGLEEEAVDWEGRHDPVGIRSIFATFAAWIALPEPLRTDLLDDVEWLARNAFGGTVTRPYKTVIYTAQRRPR